MSAATRRPPMCRLYTGAAGLICGCQTCKFRPLPPSLDALPVKPDQDIYAATSRTCPTRRSVSVEHFRSLPAEVVFTDGISIQRLRTGCETNYITVTNLPLGTTIAELKAVLSNSLGGFEILPFELAPDGRSLYGTIVLLGHGRAQAVMGFMSGVKFRGVELKLQVTSNGRKGHMLDTSPDELALSADNIFLFVRWEVPSAKAIVAVKPGVEVDTAIDSINETVVEGKKLRASFKRRKWNLPFSSRWFDGSSLLEIDGLPSNITKETLQDVSSCSSIKSIKRKSIHLQRSLDSLHRDLEKVAPCGTKDFRRDYFSAVESRSICVAIKFHSWDHAMKGYRFLEDQTLPYLGEDKPRLYLLGPYRYTIYIPIQQYKAHQSALKNIAESHSNDKGALLFCSKSESGQSASIEVVGADKRAVGMLKVQVESLVAGKTLYVWDRFFESDVGEVFLEKVFRKTGAWVSADRGLKLLRVFGEPSAAAYARKMIRRKIEKLDARSFTLEIRESSVDFFLQFGLPALRDILGEHRVVLDLLSIPSAVTIVGGEDARHRLQSLVEESLISGALTQHSAASVPCPICLDIPTNPVRLDCGHSYCDGCIRHLLGSACESRSFPLRCIGDDGNCRVSLSMTLIHRYLTNTRIRQLFEIALSVHLENNPQNFRYCPTSHCPQIYHVSSQPRVFSCSSCLSSVCTCCHKEWHEGYTCQEWKYHSTSEEQDRLLKEWVDGKENVKKCPQCQVLIEKVDGCNRVQCRCKALICWKCMDVFPTGLYEHLTAVHGGAFEVPEFHANRF